jgi:hypothetical protein
MLCGVTWCYVMFCDVMWCYVVLRDVMLCYVMWCDVMWCYVMLCSVMWCDVMWCYVMLCYVMWCYVMWSCHVMWCYVMWCHVVMLFDVMWCPASLCCFKSRLHSSNFLRTICQSNLNNLHSEDTVFIQTVHFVFCLRTAVVTEYRGRCIVSARLIWHARCHNKMDIPVTHDPCPAWHSVTSSSYLCLRFITKYV